MNGWKLKQEPNAKEYGVFVHTTSGIEQTGLCRAEEAKAFLTLRLEHAVYIEAYWERGPLSLGALMLWLNAERALVRLDEHCEHYATDPHVSYDITQLPETFVNPPENGFKGNSFQEDFHRTVTKAQASAAALYWLDTGDKLSSLHWS